MNIIFQDDSILVIDKPSGMITISDNPSEETLANIIQKEFGIKPEDSIVHRLDKDTSGVIIAAKNLATHDILQNQFKDRETKKEYSALVHGIVEKKGVIEASLGRVPGGGNKFVADDEGRLAITEYEPVSHYQIPLVSHQMVFSNLNKIELKKLGKTDYNNFTLLKCFPLTGRTHQIRVHLKYINHPIIADPLYAGRKTLKIDNCWCPRLFLHAAKIGFHHPVSGKWVEFQSRLPKDLENALSLLRIEKL